MIAYLDSSVLARAYLADEDGHGQATALLADPDIATVTGTWTRIEVSGALVRAARAGRADEKVCLRRWTPTWPDRSLCWMHRRNWWRTTP